jgi:hypothetical protein
MKNVYGARYKGGKAQNVKVGGLDNRQDELFGHYYSNTQPEAFMAAEGARQGLTGQLGGNQQFQNWFNSSFSPQVQSQFLQAQAVGTAGRPPARDPGGGGGGGGGGRGGGGGAPARSPLFGGTGTTGGGAQLGATAVGGRGPRRPRAIRAHPQLNFDDFIKKLDLGNMARMAYANRPDIERFGAAGGAQGRWSWWA